MENYTIETSVKAKLNKESFEQLEVKLKEKLMMKESVDLEKELELMNQKDSRISDKTAKDKFMKVTGSDLRNKLAEGIKIGLSAEQRTKETYKVMEDIKKTYNEGIQVKLASTFQTYPLIPYFKAKKVELPPKIKTLYEWAKYDFYLLEVTFSSKLENKQYLRCVELRVMLRDNIDKVEKKSVFYKIFPENKYQEYFTAYFNGKVGIDANLEFKVDIPEISDIIEANIKPVTEIKTGIDWDLGKKTFRKAKIETLGENNQEAVWIYNMSSAEYVNDDYVSSAILQIPREAETVKVKAELKVSPYKEMWHWFSKELPPIAVEPVELNIELTPANL